MSESISFATLIRVELFSSDVIVDLSSCEILSHSLLSFSSSVLIVRIVASSSSSTDHNSSSSSSKEEYRFLCRLISICKFSRSFALVIVPSVSYTHLRAHET